MCLVRNVDTPTAIGNQIFQSLVEYGLPNVSTLGLTAPRFCRIPILAARYVDKALHHHFSKKIQPHKTLFTKLSIWLPSSSKTCHPARYAVETPGPMKSMSLESSLSHVRVAMYGPSSQEPSRFSMQKGSTNHCMTFWLLCCSPVSCRFWLPSRLHVDLFNMHGYGATSWQTLRTSIGSCTVCSRRFMQHPAKRCVTKA